MKTCQNVYIVEKVLPVSLVPNMHERTETHPQVEEELVRRVEGVLVHSYMGWVRGRPEGQRERGRVLCHNTKYVQYTDVGQRLVTSHSQSK